MFLSYHHTQVQGNKNGENIFKKIKKETQLMHTLPGITKETHHNISLLHLLLKIGQYNSYFQNTLSMTSL